MSAEEAKEYNNRRPGHRAPLGRDGSSEPQVASWGRGCSGCGRGERDETEERGLSSAARKAIAGRGLRAWPRACWPRRPRPGGSRFHPGTTAASPEGDRLGGPGGHPAQSTPVAIRGGVTVGKPLRLVGGERPSARSSTPAVKARTRSTSTPTGSGVEHLKGWSVRPRVFGPYPGRGQLSSGRASGSGAGPGGGQHL